MNRSRAKVEFITIYILRSRSGYYSLAFQNEGLLPNPLFLSSAFSGEKPTCQYNKRVTRFKCYIMKKRVCAAPTILFWLKLRGGFISRPVLVYPPQHRHPGSAPWAAEASLGWYCCQKRDFIPTHSYPLPPPPDQVRWESSNPWLKTNLAEGRSVRSASRSQSPVAALRGPSWRRWGGRSTQPRGVRGSPHCQWQHGLRSAQAAPAVLTQCQFRQFQVTQTTGNW